MRRPRILHFVWRLAEGSGVSGVARNLLKRMDLEQFEVHVCSVRPYTAIDRIDEIRDKVTFHSLSVPWESTRMIGARIVLGFTRIAGKIRPDVLHTHGGEAWYTAPSALFDQGIRGRILDIHIVPRTRRRVWLSSRIGGAMVRRLGYQPVVHSSAVRAEIAEAYNLGSESITLIPLGIDTDHFAHPQTLSADWRRVNAIPEDALVVLCVARLVPVKNLPLYMEVARQVLACTDNVHFLLVGDGPLRGALEDLVRTNGLQSRIRFLGWRLDMVDIYHASDLFLSTSDFEGFGLAIVEAMAAGKPVVTTSVGGVVDLVPDVSIGRPCPAGDGRALAHAVLELLQDPALRSRLGEAGQERARRHFHVGTMVRKYEELYARMAGEAYVPLSVGASGHRTAQQ